MSFWTNVARPAVIMGGASVASSLASVAFPAQATLFQTLSTLFAGATLHAVNPATAAGVAKVSVTSTNPVTNQVTQTTAQSIPAAAVEAVPEVKVDPVVVQTAPAVQPVQPVGLTAEQIAIIVAQTIAALSLPVAQPVQPQPIPQATQS
jgi:hypothetical protein